jgi:hypothetical protein
VRSSVPVEGSGEEGYGVVDTCIVHAVTGVKEIAFEHKYHRDLIDLPGFLIDLMALVDQRSADQV